MSVRHRSVLSAAALGLTLMVLFAWGSPARAGLHRHHVEWGGRPADGYAVPIQSVYQFPAVIAWQPPTPPGYAVPIQHVYQFPAVIADQPPLFVPFAPPTDLFMPDPTPWIR